MKSAAPGDIEIHNPEVEALIRGRMSDGGFKNAEEVILQALKSSPPGRSVGRAFAPFRRPEKSRATVRGFPI